MPRNLPSLSLAALLAGCAPALSGGPANDADLAITNVAVVDVERGRILRNQSVLIKGDRIIAVAPAAQARLASTTRRIDGTRKFLIPGLWDMHAHLHLSGNPTRIELPLFVAHGVTGVRVMGADRPSVNPELTPGLLQHRALQGQVAAGTLTGPRLLALASWAVNGTTGISDSMPAFYRARTREEGRQLARYFKQRGFDFVKIYNNVSREGYLGLAEEARALGLPFAGHEPASLSAVELSNAGQKSIEHSRIFLFNCFAGADSMQKGLLRSSQTVRRQRMVDEYDPRVCAEVFRTFARNGTWITPTHGTRKMDAFAGDSAYRRDARMKYIPLPQQLNWLADANGMVASDSSAAGRKSYLDFYRKGLTLTRDAYRAGVPVMVGTDAGDSFVFPGSSVHDELDELVKAGLTPAEALRAATLNGARYLERITDFGTVQAGRYADLVLLDGNPLEDIGNTRRIHAVVLNGRHLDRARLDALLAGVETAARPDAQTRLVAAAMSGDTLEIVRALDAGARIDSLVGTRRPLNWAALNNRVPAIRTLLARGAGINLPNGTGFTAVHHAAEAGAHAALTALIAAGADLTLRTTRGMLPLDIARARADQSAVRILEGARPPNAAQSGLSPDSALADLTRRIFASPEFAVRGFGPARWLDGGAAYTTLEPAPGGSGARELVRYTTATGDRSVLVSAAQLTPRGAREPLTIDDYQWSPDGAQLLIFTNSERVWRDNTRGDYWVLTRASGALRKLGGAGAPASSLLFAKFAPGGDRVGYVRGGDLYVERVAGGAITRLTTNGSRTLVNGTTDWVYEEEFFLRDAFRWSPDGSRIAFWQFDMTGVRDFLLINNTDSLYSFTTPVQYPKAGGTNSAVRAGVIAAAGGPVTWLELPGDPRDDYLPRMEWAANSTELVLQRMNRRQNRNRVFLADAATGKLRPVLTETDSLHLDVVNDWRWLRGGREFLWVTERSGWRHVEVVARDGSSRGDITPGPAEVVSVAAVDTTGGWLYYIASPDNPTQRYLYRARLDGRGQTERLTPTTAPGTHSYLISPDARWAIHRHSRLDQPPVIDLVQLPSHTVVRVFQDNAELRARVAALGGRAPEFFRVPVDSGVALDAWMLFPRDFDPAKRYPLLMHVYSEPWSQTVLDAWGGGQMLWHRALADRGYIVASVDNRGTPGPRGRAFRKAGTEAIGTLSSRDQAEAVRVLTRTRAYLDATRVAIWGWSGGGSATLNALFRYPDVYQVGMSVAPVPDQRLYDTIYQERYMGRPQDNEAGYTAGSPISHAAGLAGKLLLVHGSGDDNVHYQGTERLVNRLVELGKPFDLMVYPNRSHCICEGRGTTLHVYQLLGRYLVKQLPAGGR